MGFSKPPGVPCPDPNKHCGDDVVSVSIDNPYFISFAIVVVIIWAYFIIQKPKITFSFSFKLKK